MEVLVDSPGYRFLCFGAGSEVWGAPRSYKQRQDLITGTDTAGVEETEFTVFLEVMEVMMEVTVSLVQMMLEVVVVV